MTPRELCEVPPKLGRKINPALKGLDAATISFMRHRLAGLYLAMHRAAEREEAARLADPGKLILFSREARDAVAQHATARQAYVDQRDRVEFAECFAATAPHPYR